MGDTRRLFARILACVTAILLATAGILLSTVMPAAAATAPVEQRSPTGVTADGLPTVQIDGVVWDTEIIGDTVYVGGQFANARPAGAAPGTNLTPRSNLLAFNIRTGALITSFAPSVNGQIKTITASPDGSRIYIGGSFTSVSGVARYRLAALNATTGAVITSFAAGVNSGITAITVTNSAVYVGGGFTSVGSSSRPHLAAFNPANGALLGWAPTVDTGSVNAIVATPDRSKIIVAGSFSSVNGATALGMASVNATSGALEPWIANQVIHNYGSSAAMLSLSTDGTNIYAGGYWFGGTGNFEGVVAANPSDGSIRWLADCHGDTYDAAAAGGVLYAVTHWHHCVNIGAFPDTNPRNQWYRSNAMTVEAKGTVAPNSQGGYYDFQGYGAPAMINWFPVLDAGTYTGQSQASWTTEGNSEYVVHAGEFPTVNGVAQQGIVRFAIPSLAPKKQGPRISAPESNPTLLNIGNGAVRVKWTANWDRDDQVLNYEVQRQGTATPLYTTTVTSQFWNRPSLSFTDTSTVVGQTYNYRISAYDNDGNRVNSAYVSITPTASTSAYVSSVIADGASSYWRMSSTGSYPDYIGNLDMTAGSGTAANVSGALNGDSNGSATFDGTGNGTAGSSTTINGPDTFTAEAWFNTTSTSGGKIFGFGDSFLSQSSSYDRHIYLDNAGRVFFGVYPGGVRTLQSGTGFNDGQWHHVVAQLSSAGMTLYLDGIRVGANGSVTSAQPYMGRWRIGGDNIGGWTNQPSSYFLAGSIDEVAIYPTALTGAQIRDHYTKSGRTVNVPPAPADTYGASVYADNPTLFWRFDEASGTTAKDASPNLQDGQLSGGVTLGQASNVGAPTGTADGFNGFNATVASKAAFGNPTTYTEEAWFKTTTTNGGKIIGFGNTQSGTSTSYDRHVYMENNGSLTFGVWTGFTNTITSPASYNDNRWHHVVATQSTANGMRLYVDGKLVGTHSQNSAQDYGGYWRVGGDSAWCCQPWFNGLIDEVAIYDAALSQAQVKTHYDASSAAINEPPTAAFTETCVQGQCSFDSSGSSDSDGTITAYSWNFGDGTTSAQPNPVHGYDVSGTYTVSLTVTDNKAATTVASHSVAVTVPPANQLPTAVVTNTCNELDCSFDGSASSDPDGSIDAYLWNFGDGTTSTLSAPPHTYAADGTYSVSLKVTDNRGGTHTATKSVTVKANLKPVAEFTTSCVDLVCGFNSAGSNDPDGQITGFNWNFGDGSTESTDANPSHTFATAGTYSVKLTVIDDHNASTTKTVPVTVTVNADPVAAFSTNCTGLTCAPDGSASSDSDGTIASYSWNFGDGSPAVSGKVPPPYTYNSAGSYTITLTVTDNRGAIDAETKTVTVAPPPNQLPTASFTTSCTNLACSFNGSASNDPDGTLVSYEWNFGDGVTASVESPPHTYDSPGTYSVSLTVKDDRGGTHTLTKAVEVSNGPANQPPTAAFTSTCTALACSFNSSTSTDPDGTIASRSWDFGDGTTSTSANPSHSYPAAGTYPVTLRVTDDDGAIDEETKSVTVAAAANQEPVAAFTSTVSGLSASFNGTGSSDPDGTIVSYAWSFGDGSTATGATPNRGYAGTGTYEVKLTVTDDDGATSSITKSVVVGSNPIVRDAFGRTVTRWGSADTGGTYTYAGSTHSTNGSTGDVRLAAAGNSATASLAGVSARDVNVVADIAIDKTATGGGVQTTFIVRKSGTNDYRMTLQHLSNGSVRLNISRIVNGTPTSLRDVNVPAATYTPGSVLRVRFTATGNGTTALAAKVWKVGTAEPTSAQATVSEATAALQSAGSFAIYNYLSGSATNGPVTLSLDNVLVTAN